MDTDINYKLVSKLLSLYSIRLKDVLSLKQHIISQEYLLIEIYKPRDYTELKELFEIAIDYRNIYAIKSFNEDIELELFSKKGKCYKTILPISTYRESWWIISLREMVLKDIYKTGDTIYYVEETGNIISYNYMEEPQFYYPYDGVR